MPTVTTNRNVTIEELTTALQQQLGSSYQITARGSGPQEALKVKQSTASIANVHLDHNGDTTTFRVHGGGLIISRMLNEFGIAKKVSQAIEASLGSTPAASTPPAASAPPEAAAPPAASAPAAGSAPPAASTPPADTGGDKKNGDAGEP